MSKELLKRMRDTLHGLEETHYDLYWDIQAELDKPEQEPIPVYTASPKREPLSDDEVIVPEWMIARDEWQAFVIGVRFAEKMHGITGETK